MADDKRYNGWTNYETWNVALWLGNEQGSYTYWTEAAQEAYNEAAHTPSANARLTGSEPFTQEERAVYNLSQQLKSEIEEAAPDLGASMFADLLNAALSEVNWGEIAEHYIADADKTAEPEEADTDGE